jgi:hypothetical protein
MSTGSNVLPRFLMLYTNSKNPRYSGSFSCEMPRCGRSQLRNSDPLQLMDGLLRPPLLQNPRVCAFYARGSSAICLLSSAPFRWHIPPVGLVICGLAPSPRGVSLPHATAWVERFCSVTPADHVHMTARTSAYPRCYSRPLLLAGSHPIRHAVGTYSR